ncbi:MAG: glycoside hydrolase family 3 C-terminal domain-containing protein [Bacillota bacterium]
MEDRINDLLGKLTLEEKVALTTGKDYWTTVAVERLGIPSIWLNDGPHGVRRPHSGSDIGLGDAKPATCFPTASALASSWDTALIETIGKALAGECHALDVQVLLGPGINIKRSPLGGRNFEYYSEDPHLTAALAVAFVNAVQSEGIGTSLKHYACNNQEFERMTISADLDERTLREIYLAAFEQVVKEARPWTVMASYNRINGVPATENSYLLTEILKEEWGFTGCVVSDWTAVNYKEKSLAAGMDLEMPGKGGIDDAKIAGLVREGLLNETVLDEAVRRILRLVLLAVQYRRPGVVYDQTAHHALARRAAGECAVLLKNEDNLLPLDANKLASLAVIGRFARDPRYQGAGSSQVTPTKLDAAYDELAKLLGSKTWLTYAAGYSESDSADETLIKEAVSTARKAEVAVIFAGLPPQYESEGFDRVHLDLPPAHNRLIEAVCAVQPNTIVFLANGSAVTMPWLNKPKAILEGWLGGQASGGAAADILLGLVNPSGKLAETFPYRLEDTPAFLNFPGEEDRVRYGEGLFVGYRYYDRKKITPLFPFGFGLSYTTFEYSNLKLNRDTISDHDVLQVGLSVKNSGPRAGREIVQLYLRDETASRVRPDKELKAFAKVALEPGETKTVQFSLTGRDFAFYDAAGRNWIIETGWFEILIGSSSTDLKLATKVYMDSQQRLKRHFHRLTPFKYFLSDDAAREIIRQTLGETPLVSVLLSGDLDQTLVNLLGNMPAIKMLDYTGGSISVTLLDELIDQINRQE